MRRARNARRTIPTTPAADATSAAIATIAVPVLAPRNPYQQLARQRKAGAHDADARKRRRIDKSELRRALEEK